MSKKRTKQLKKELTEKLGRSPIKAKFDNKGKQYIIDEFRKYKKEWKRK